MPARVAEASTRGRVRLFPPRLAAGVPLVAAYTAAALLLVDGQKVIQAGPDRSRDIIAEGSAKSRRRRGFPAAVGVVAVAVVDFFCGSGFPANRGEGGEGVEIVRRFR